MSTAITVGELLRTVPKLATLTTLERLYEGYAGEDPDGYSEMWDTLLKLQPRLSNCQVYLHTVETDDDPPETRVDVSGIHSDDPKKTLYAIEYVDWEEWLAMPVVLGHGLEGVPLEEQLAHCLYELSWAGYTQERQQTKRQELLEMHEDAMAQFGRGTRRH